MVDKASGIRIKGPQEPSCVCNVLNHNSYHISKAGEEIHKELVRTFRELAPGSSFSNPRCEQFVCKGKQVVMHSESPIFIN